MSIPSISGVTPIAMPTPVASTGATASADGGGSFSSILSGAINSVQSTQATADQLDVAAVTGNLNDIHAATIASTRAQIEMQLVSAVRNQAVSGFNDLMNMSA
jgi:flagellar hook-basal body complex protein FliE